MPDCDAIVVDFSDAIACIDLRVVVIGGGGLGLQTATKI